MFRGWQAESLWDVPGTTKSPVAFVDGCDDNRRVRHSGRQAVIVVCLHLFLEACAAAPERQGAAAAPSAEAAQWTKVGRDAWSQGPASPGLAAGVAAYERGDYQTAFRLLKLEADRGNSAAMVNLGFLYARGHGVGADQAEALRLYRRAAAQGDAEGMNAIGYKYDRGTGVTPDLAEAVRWYCMAALRSNPRALNNLALLLDQGRGVPRDRQEARKLWRRSAEIGNAAAMLNLGLLLLRDYPPGAPERAQGKFWLGRSLESGSPAARWQIGELARSNYVDPAELSAAARRPAPPPEEPTLSACRPVS